MPPDKPARWSPEQDRRLREAVQRFGDKDQWQQVATLVPGRDNKACRKRWLHSLVPTVKKTAWSKEEDDKLVMLVAKHGDKWAAIARGIPGRTDDACSKRYREALDPVKKKTEWTDEEDRLLLEMYSDKGPNWKDIGKTLLRSGLSCRNRWHLLERKKGREVESSLPCDNKPSLSSQSEESSCTPSPSSSSSPCSSSNSEQPGDPVKVLYYGPDGTRTCYEVPCDTFHASPHDLTISTPLNQHYEGPPLSRALTTVDAGFSSLKAAVGLPTQSHSSVPYSPPQAEESRHEPVDWNMSAPFEGSQQPFTIEDSGDNLDMTYILANLDRQLVSCMESSENSLPGLLEFPLSSGPPSSSSLSNFSYRPMINSSLSSSPQRSPIVEPAFDGATRHWDMHPSHFSYEFPMQLESIPPMDTGYYTTFPTAVNTPVMTTPSKTSDGLTSPDLESPAFSSFPNLDSDPYEQAISSASPSPLESVHSLPQAQTMPPSPEGSMQLWVMSPDSPPSQSLLFSGRTKPRRPRIPGTSELQLAVAEDEEDRQLSDENAVRPYACGHPECWTSAPDNHTRYTTAKILLAHYREKHEDCEGEEELDKPFKCGLPGCDKAWKNINGLQYHLHVSPFHFRNSPVASERGHSTPSSKSDGKFKCTVTNCMKSYKNPGGLKYHLRHGHPKKLPVQVVDLCGGSPPMNWPRRTRKELMSAGKLHNEL